MAVIRPGTLMPFIYKMVLVVRVRSSAHMSIVFMNRIRQISLSQLSFVIQYYHYGGNNQYSDLIDPKLPGFHGLLLPLSGD